MESPVYNPIWRTETSAYRMLPDQMPDMISHIPNSFRVRNVVGGGAILYSCGPQAEQRVCWNLAYSVFQAK